ncbi:MAG: sigma-70 family RNA polymerase sigma factor [Planctomycetaceae bacterium]|nr:sigma-70 family RNA polymerase sigma factor [Planctomycetaceae bacterium]
MDTTSVSLLEKLQQPDNQKAWSRFVDLYAPLIFTWARKRGLTSSDAADLVQDVMTILVRKLPEFHYDAGKRFRGWLRTITVNRASDMFRRNAKYVTSIGDSYFQGIADESDRDLFEETNYRAFLVERAKQLIEPEFESRIWNACWSLINSDESAAKIGERYDMSANAVRIAKCRVTKRLRQELSGIPD